MQCVISSEECGMQFHKVIHNCIVQINGDTSVSGGGVEFTSENHDIILACIESHAFFIILRMSDFCRFCRNVECGNRVDNIMPFMVM